MNDLRKYFPAWGVEDCYEMSDSQIHMLACMARELIRDYRKQCARVCVEALIEYESTLEKKFYLWMGEIDKILVKDDYFGGRYSELEELRAELFSVHAGRFHGYGKQLPRKL